MSLLEKALGRFRGDTVATINDDHDDVIVLEDRIITKLNKKGDSEMEHMLFKISVKDEYGEYKTFWKAVSLLTITRTPFQTRESKKLKQITDEVLRGLCRTEVNYLLLVANILTPKALGVLYCYGVQAIGDTPEEAMLQASHDYMALRKGLTGAFKGMEYRRLTEEEGRSVSRKLSEMQELLMIRGIPDARESAGNKTVTGIGQGDVNPGAEEQVEEFIRAMSDQEFVFLVLTSPVEAMDINRWLGVVSEELSRWKSQMSGSKVASAGLSLPISMANNAGSSAGTTHAIAVGHTTAHTVGQADGTTTTFSQTHTVGASHGGSTTHTDSVGQNWGTSHTDTASQSQALSHTTSTTNTQSHTHTDGTSLTNSVSHSVGGGTAHSVTDSTGTSHAVTTGHTTGGGTSDTTGTSWSTSHGVTNTNSHGATNSSSHGGSTTQSHSTGGSTTNTTTTGHSTGTTNTNSQSTTHTSGAGTSSGTSRMSGHSNAIGVNGGVDLGVRVGGSDTNTSSNSFSITAGNSTMNSTGHTTGSSLAHSFTNSNSQSHAVGSNFSNSVANGSNWSSGTATTNSTSQGVSNTTSQGGSASHGVSTNFSNSNSVSNGTTTGHSVGNTTSSNWSNGTSTARGTSSSDSYGTSTSQGVSNGVTNSTGTSSANGTSQGNSVGSANAVGSNWSNSVSDSSGVSHGTSHTNSVANQTGTNAANNFGASSATNAGMSGGMAVGPFFSVSKSYQWFDARVENLVNILDAQRQRLLQSQEGQGMMYVDVFIFVSDEGTKRAAQTAASAAFFGNKFPTPLEVIEPDDEELSHLQMHGRAFSPCNSRENTTDILDQYRWSTLLLPSELSAYAAPLRLEIGGASTNVEDIPIMRVPTNRMNRESLVGNLVSGDRWHEESGYVTPYEYRICSQELHNMGIFGASRTGKTVGATRLLTEIYQNMKFPSKTGEMIAPSIVVLDWKRDWRILQRYTHPDKFHHYTLADYDVNPIRMNLLQVPPGVSTEEWMDSFIEMFLLSFSMGGRAKSIMWQHLVALYNRVDAFRHPENSWKVTADDLYEAVFKSKEGFEKEKRRGGKVGNETRDAYTRLIDRLIYFHWGKLRDMFCYSAQDATTIPDLCQEDGHVTVIEGEGLEPEAKKFVISLIGTGIYTYGLRKGGFNGGLILVLEEAHQVLMGAGGDSASDSTVLNIGESKWEIMFAEAAGWNMFLFAISQSPSKMPAACLTNTGITMTFRIDIEDDINIMMKKFAKDPRYDHRDIARWLSRTQVGWCVVRSSRVMDFKDSEPSIVAVTPLAGTKPTNDELRLWSRTPTLPDFDAIELDS